MPLAMATILNATVLIFKISSCSPMYVNSLSGQSETHVILIYDPMVIMMQLSLIDALLVFHILLAK